MCSELVHHSLRHTAPARAYATCYTAYTQHSPRLTALRGSPSPKLPRALRHTSVLTHYCPRTRSCARLPLHDRLQHYPPRVTLHTRPLTHVTLHTVPSTHRSPHTCHPTHTPPDTPTGTELASTTRPVSTSSEIVAGSTRNRPPSHTVVHGSRGVKPRDVAGTKQRAYLYPSLRMECEGRAGTHDALPGSTGRRPTVVVRSPRFDGFIPERLLGRNTQTGAPDRGIGRIERGSKGSSTLLPLCLIRKR